jgi:NAD-dependent deacetylase
VLKPNTVLFGEQLPPAALEKAHHESSTCKIMLVIGTSAVVQPAASLPYLAKQNGAVVIEINPEKAFPGVNFHIEEKAGTALPNLLKEIKDIRKGAARTLRWFKEEPLVVDYLVSALDDDYWKVREAATRSLWKIHTSETIEPLIGMLQDNHPMVRASAIYGLDSTKDPRVVEPLAETLNDENSKVRWEAARGLGYIKDVRAVPALIAALNDPDPNAQNAIESALRSITRADLGRDPHKWQKWWEENKEKS